MWVWSCSGAWVKCSAAARIKLGGAEESIAKVCAAGLQAAGWHRMAQIAGQVSHDITRRIEEMGQYHF